MTIIKKLIAEKKVIVCLGSGGVGKTTSAAGIAIAAARTGKRTALLSIDPAKRLAAALGIDVGFDLTEVVLPGIAPQFLYATMIDQKTVFDDMVRSCTPDGKIREKILAHPLYKAASTNFGGAIEFMALAKLYKILSSNRFDLVILDTPPDAHAMDFLAKPDILSGFMEGKVMSWVIKPFFYAQKMGLSKVFAAGEKLAGGLAQVAGIKAMQTLAEFLILMQDTVRGFHQAGEAIEKQLRAQTTAFCLISTVRKSPLRSAFAIAQQLRAIEFGVDVMLFNRILDPKVRANALSLQELTLPNGTAKEALLALYRVAKAQEQLMLEYGSKIENALGRTLSSQLVYERSSDVHSADGLLEFSQSL